MVVVIAVFVISLPGQYYVTNLITDAIKTVEGGRSKFGDSLAHSAMVPFSPEKSHFRVLAPGKLSLDLRNGFGLTRSSAGFGGCDYCIQDNEIGFHAGECLESGTTGVAFGDNSSSSSSGSSLNSNLPRDYSTPLAREGDSPQVLDQRNLDDECSRIVQSIGGHLLEKTNLYLGSGGYPGREIYGTISKQRKDFRTRVYYDAANKRFFYIGVIGIDSRVGSAQADKFLGSLEVLP
jgi:hypothetical protein